MEIEYLEPIKLLQKELDKWKKALRKSDQSYENGDINMETNRVHHNNLIPKIEQYTHAIRTLNQFA